MLPHHLYPLILIMSICCPSLISLQCHWLPHCSNRLCNWLAENLVTRESIFYSAPQLLTSCLLCTELNCLLWEICSDFPVISAFSVSCVVARTFKKGESQYFDQTQDAYRPGYVTLTNPAPTTVLKRMNSSNLKCDSLIWLMWMVDLLWW
jgi:hypothetical protein